MLDQKLWLTFSKRACYRAAGPGASAPKVLQLAKVVTIGWTSTIRGRLPSGTLNASLWNAYRLRKGCCHHPTGSTRKLNRTSMKRADRQLTQAGIASKVSVQSKALRVENDLRSFVRIQEFGQSRYSLGNFRRHRRSWHDYADSVLLFAHSSAQPTPFACRVCRPCRRGSHPKSR
jgi:hypothetical protein